MSDDDLDELGRELAALFPVASRRRGWAVGNLGHYFENTEFGVEESWRCDIYGPTDIESRWHRVVGHPRFSTVSIHAAVTGSCEAPTREDLVNQVRLVIETLDLAHLTEPKVTS